MYTQSGNITVRPGSAGTVSITGRIHVGDAWMFGLGNNHKDEVQQIESNPPLSQNGNSIRVDYVNRRNISIDYEITAPPDSKVRTKSGSGDQTIEGMQSGVDIETGSGDVKLDNLAGEIRIHTGSGNVEARGAAGPFEARAGSGDITIEEKAKGDVRLETGSGNIHVRGVDGGLNASTGSGDVQVDGNPANTWHVRTGSGNAELRLPQQAAFDLDVSTSSGSVEVNHPVTTTVQGPRGRSAQIDSRQSARRWSGNQRAHRIGRRAGGLEQSLVSSRWSLAKPFFELRSRTGNKRLARD